MRLSRVKEVCRGVEDWEPGADADPGADEVESGELGARPPFNFATLATAFVILGRESYNIRIWHDPLTPLEDDSYLLSRTGRIECQS